MSHKGYDYSADIWSWGILLYEMYENRTPFGSEETEEKVIYQNLTAYSSTGESLVFTEDRTPLAARALLKEVLHLTPQLRCGYADNGKAIKGSKYFAGNTLHIYSFYIQKYRVVNGYSIIYNISQTEW